MPPFKKNLWLLSAAVAFTCLQFLAFALETYRFIGRAELGEWGAAVRDSGPRLLIIAIGFLAGCYGYLVFRTHHVGTDGFTFYTLRRGRVTIPWSAVHFAAFRKGAVIIKTAEFHLQIPFVYYRHRSELEAFLRERLMSAAAEP